jgi:hypothetical protein
MDIAFLASAWDPPLWARRSHACPVTMRQEAMRALYEGSLADPGDCNPYAGRSLVLATLWTRGYRRMLRVRVDSGPAMQRYLKARAASNRAPR